MIRQPFHYSQGGTLQPLLHRWMIKMDVESFINRFHQNDRLAARELIGAISSVTIDEVLSYIRDRTLSIPKSKEKLAIYVERELEGGANKQAVFSPVKRRAIKPKKFPLVAPIRGRNKVGSEGPLARLATQIAGTNTQQILLSPGPESIRNKKNCKHIVIITDIIGSGTRIIRMLDAFHKVATVRSWHSLRWIRFHIVSYTASSEGKLRVESHRFKPIVHCFGPLPTIKTEFAFPRNGISCLQIEDLCRRYDPLRATDPDQPFGYKNTGALITIGGCCPNNSPRLLWEKAGRWKPLFANFVSFSIQHAVEDDFNRMVRILDAFGRNWRIGPAQLTQVWSEARPLVVALTAMRKGVCARDELAGLIKLSFDETDDLIAKATSAGWIDEDHKLTYSGRHLIRELAKMREVRNALPSPQEIIYLPQQLRAPV